MLKYIFLLFLIFIVIFNSFSQTESEIIDQKILVYDEKSLINYLNVYEEKIKSEKTSYNYFIAGKVSFYLSRLADTNYNFTKQNEFALKSLSNLNNCITINNKDIEAHYFLIEIVTSLIKDAPSYLTYNSMIEKELKILASLDKDSKYLKYIEIKNLIRMPSAYGGNLTLGYDKLIKLNESNPELFEIELNIVQALLKLNNEKEAQILLENMIQKNPDNLPANKLLTKFKVEKNNPVIKKIYYINNFKTNNYLVKKCIAFKEGEIFNIQKFKNTKENLKFFPDITGITLNFDYNENSNEVEIGIILQENNMQIIILTGGFGMPAYNASNKFFNYWENSPSFALVYINKNFLNLNIELTLITAFVFWQINLTRKNLIFNTIDMEINFNSFILPNSAGINFYNGDGIPIHQDRIFNKNWVKADIGIGKSFDWGLKFFARYEFSKDFYFRINQTNDNMILPDNLDEGIALNQRTPLLKHTGKLELGYQNINYSDSIRNIPDGFQFNIGLTYEQYQNYRKWGQFEDGYINEAPQNGLGSLKWYLKIGKYIHFAKILNFKIDGSYYGGVNYYELNKYSLSSGQYSSGLVLHGYRSQEFRGEHIFLINSAFGIEPIKNIVHIELLNDLAFLNYREITGDSFKPLTSFGIKFNFGLPYDIKLSAEYYYALNTLNGNFNNGRHFFNISIARAFLF